MPNELIPIYPSNNHNRFAAVTFEIGDKLEVHLGRRQSWSLECLCCINHFPRGVRKEKSVTIAIIEWLDRLNSKEE